ncbi:MAG: hypothetical protein RTU63_05660 [Candidatus Thorarchaeota archaeon]
MTLKPPYSTKIDSLVSVTKLRFIFLLEIVVILLVLSLAGTSTVLGATDSLGAIDDFYDRFYLADADSITDIPYVSQQVNGLCHWATQSMQLQTIGIPLDLAGVCAATGIGFSMSYLRYEDYSVILTGSDYQQQAQVSTIEELYDLDREFYLDTDRSEFSSLFSLTLQAYGINWTEIDGWDDAFRVLKENIDDGYPLEIYVNLYHLPHPDYDFVRILGSSDDNPSHSILITGYNETAQVAYVMDPAIGVLEHSEVLPNEENGFYEINFTSLNLAWRKSYACTVIKPNTENVEPTDDFATILGNHIVDRLRGERSSYDPDAEEVFFWNFGSNAFRAMAAELTGDSLSFFLDEFEEYPLETKASILRQMGLEIEVYLTLQYESYLPAINALPSVLSDLNLDDFVEEGKLAFEHFDVLSNHSTLNDIFYTGGATIVSDTFSSIAYQYEFIHDGDILTAIADFEEDLTEIQFHLNAIADAWDAAADALERELNDSDLWLPSLSGVGAITVITIAIIAKRRRDAQV